MKIDMLPLDAARPYPQNPRRNAQAVAKVAASLQAFGWRQPIVVDSEMVIVVGHTRWEAAKSLGLAEAPFHIATDLSPEQLRAYRLADNRVGEEAEWDEDLLALELAELRLADFDLSLTGFDAGELAQALAGADVEGELAEADAAAQESTGTPGALSARFGVPPFTVLSARDGWWQDRKRHWLSLGIKSELGRGAAVEGGAAPGGSMRPLDRQKAGEQTASFKNQDKLAAFQKGDKAARKASPGGNRMPATNYSKSRAKGDGSGRAIPGTKAGGEA